MDYGVSGVNNFNMDRKSKTKLSWRWLQVLDSRVISGAPGEIRTPDPLLRSRLSTFIKTCRSERKAAGIQQVVTTSDQLLAPSSSPLSRLFAAICHNLYYVFMTAAHVSASIAIMVQSKAPGI
jgi:hypothetical protein